MKARMMVFGGLAAFVALCVGAVWRGGTVLDRADPTRRESLGTVVPGEAAVTTTGPGKPATSSVPVTSATTTSTPATTVAIGDDADPTTVPSTPDVPSASEASVPTTSAGDDPSSTVGSSPEVPMPSVTIARSTAGLMISGAVFGIVEHAALVTTAQDALGTSAVDASELAVVEGDTSIGDAQVAAAVRFLFLIRGGLQIDTIVLERGVLAVTGHAASAALAIPVQAATDAARADGVTVIVDVAGLGGDQ